MFSSVPAIAAAERGNLPCASDVMALSSTNKKGGSTSLRRGPRRSDVEKKIKLPTSRSSHVEGRIDAEQ